MIVVLQLSCFQFYYNKKESNIRKIAKMSSKRKEKNEFCYDDITEDLNYVQNSSSNSQAAEDSQTAEEHDYVNQTTEEMKLIECRFTRNPIDARKIECVVCTDRCIVADQTNKLKLHEKAKIRCAFCKKILKSLVSFHYHLNSYHGEKVEKPPLQVIDIRTIKQKNLMDQDTPELDWAVEEVISSCLFVTDPNTPKNVQCIACAQNCQAEAEINDLKVSDVTEIPCYCGQVLNDRQGFYKHFVFFHSDYHDTKPNKLTEIKDLSSKMQMEDEELMNCKFNYNLSRKDLVCCNHPTEECSMLELYRKAKPSQEIYIPCFCGKVLKTRLIFQKHCEHIHPKSETVDSKSNIYFTPLLAGPSTSCSFTRDPINPKSIICSKCTTFDCPMAAKIQNAKLFEELFIPCECGKIMKNRCNFMKHFKIYHELKLGMSNEKRKGRKKATDDDNDDSDEFIPNPECRFMRDEKNQRNLHCVVCKKDECDFLELIHASNMNRTLNIPCFCGQKLRSRKRFFQHYNFFHCGGKERSKTCSVCDIEFESKAMKYEHERTEHQIEFKHSCYQCGKMFFRSDYLSYHLESCGKVPSIRNKNQVVLSCGVCNFTFMREDTFHKHLETAHVDVDVTEDALVIKLDEVEEDSNPTETVSDFYCQECSKHFVSEKVMQKHVEKIHNNVKIKCDKCDETFVHESTKKFHMIKVHGKARAFSCTICDYACDKKVRFQAHMAKHENPNAKFPCPICDQQFNSIDTMALHRSRHKTKDPYVCEYCKKQFLSKPSYTNHVKLHTGEGLFYCPTCKKSFVKKYSLQAHREKSDH